MVRPGLGARGVSLEGRKECVGRRSGGKKCCNGRESVKSVLEEVEGRALLKRIWGANGRGGIYGKGGCRWQGRKGGMGYGRVSRKMQ